MKFIALIFAKFVFYSIRFLGLGGATSAPGLIAQKIDKKIIYKLAKKLPKGAVVISGTNGKTTTARLTADIFKEAGFSVVQNRSGSNLSRGIASALIENSNIFGKPKSEVAILEVDEAAMKEVTAQVNPSIVLITNIFRDQLDRYGEIDRTFQLLGASLEQVKDAIVLLNADDPLVADLKNFVPNNSKVEFYGIDDQKIALGSAEGAIDVRECMMCGKVLNYSARYYGHLGIYTCPTGDSNRPKTLVSAKSVILNGMEGSKLTLDVISQKVEITTTLPGLYNVYNILSAVTIAHLLNVPVATYRDAVHDFEAVFGRNEKITIADKHIYLQLIKNPVGFDQVMHTLSFDQKKKKSLLIGINDNYADGRDVSWLWDVDFELLREQLNFVVTSGIRANDMTLRLKYADYDTKKITTLSDFDKALSEVLEKTPTGETIYAMLTYTAMLEMRKIIKLKVPSLKNFWEE